MTLQDKIPFEKFMAQHEPRIYHQIFRIHIHPSNYDDFYTEGLLGLWDAYLRYDEKKGKLGTFINYKIRFRLVDLLRQKVLQSERQTSYLEQMKIELTTGNRERHTHVPLLEFEDHLILDTSFWQTIQAQLTTKQWKWVQYYIIAELSIKEIMEIENVSADAVKSWGKQVRKKLKTEAIKRQIRKEIERS